MSMRPLHVLLPMAGLGSRFSQAGFELPKPLIPVDGQPMVLKALSSLEGFGVPLQVTVVLRRVHEQEFQLASLLQKALPDSKIVIIDDMTRGAVETCLRAEPEMKGDRGLLVMDCDLWFRSPAYAELIRGTLSSEDGPAGALLNFEADAPRYSYAEREGFRVLRTAEKKVISKHAVVGAYFFSHERTFLDVAHQLMGRNLTGDVKEYYLSLLYNLLLERGDRIEARDVEAYASFGTPEELAAYDRGRVGA